MYRGRLNRSQYNGLEEFVQDEMLWIHGRSPSEPVRQVELEETKMDSMRAKFW